MAGLYTPVAGVQLALQTGKNCTPHKIKPQVLLNMPQESWTLD
jgi:hypothetical protein